MNQGKDWLYFNEELVPEWCQYAEQHLKAVLGFDIGVELMLPKEDEARKCLGKPESLKGLLKLKAEGKCAEIPLPIPFDGVFITFEQETEGIINSGACRSQTYVWGNWLAERPGVRRVTTSNGNEELRLGFPDGSHLAIPLSPADKKVAEKGSIKEKDLIKQAKSLLQRLSYSPLWTEDDYPQKWLRDALEMTVGKGKEDLDEAIRVLVAAIYNHKEELKETDADDLECRTLITFPRWLIIRLCKYLYREYLKCNEDDNFIQHLCEQKDIGAALVPIGRLIGAKDNAKRAKDNALVRIDPLNPVELMASLTGVRRYRFRRETAALIPENKRQNHVSFDGRICPLESPESELIGLQLQLARGARVAADGSITPSDSGNMLDRLGWGTSLIPFVNRNDGARDMMGAKNLRQSVEIGGRQPPSVTTGAERELADKTARLVSIGVCPSCEKDGKFALGRDLLVAYMPWYGWNVDDAVVVRRGIVDVMSIGKHLAFSGKVKPGWKCEVASRIKDGVTLHSGDVIATLSTANGKKTRICYNDPGEAILVKAPVAAEASESIIREMRYELQKTLPLGPGDKLMGRHGNKGVVARVLDDSEMPHLPNNPNLPDAMRGKPIDILLNPHGVLSRMNPGQLLETHIGWLLHAGVQESELLSAGSSAEAIGNPSAHIDHEKVRRLLENSGLDRNGAIQLDLGNGHKTEKPVVVGYQHFVRLNHVPLLKAQARRGGEADSAYSQETRQPVRGRKAGGGMRLGEMEVWALAAYGANSILREMLGGKSDANMARFWTDKTHAPAGGSDKGFPLVLKDWLFALGIDMSVQDDGKKCQFKFLSDDDILSKIGKDHEITESSYLQECQFKSFGLEGHAPFPKEYLVRKDQDTLRLDDFLGSCGFRCQGLLEDTGIFEDQYPIYRLNIVRTGNSQQLNLKIVFQYKKETQKSCSMTVAFFSVNGEPLILDGQNELYCRLEIQEKGKDGKDRGKTVKDKIDECKQERKSVRQLLQNAIIYHKGNSSKRSPLKALSAGNTELIEMPGSVYDRLIFGSLKAPAQDGWGYIRLPHPITLDFAPNRADSKEVRTISIIPVMPLCYRMPLPESKTGNDARELNEKYKEMINACKSKSYSEEKVKDAVITLFRAVRKRLDGKDGLLRHDGLGRRVDRSFRLVIAPNPSLKWNQAEVPASILWEVLGDLVVTEQYSLALAANLIERTRDKDGGLSWHHKEKLVFDSKQKAGMIRDYLERHPETLILLNRQPSLHKYSFQAFHPLVGDDCDGEVLRLPPLCCKGFAADFDGDEMVGHLPLSEEAQREAAGLLPENNLLSVASGEAMLHYDRDFVTGMQLLYKEEKEYKDTIDEMDGCCRDLLLTDNGQCGSFGKKLVKHIFGKDNELGRGRKHIGADSISAAQKWAELAWRVCTETGFSFGFYDLLDLSKKLGSKLPVEENDQDTLKNSVVKFLQDEYNENGKTEGLSGVRAIATMVLSGANGEEQAHQLIARRGKLPNLMGDTKAIAASLVNGMNWEELFDASWNARSSLCDKKLGTGMAGGLTRQLVLALWPISIVEEDCGSNAGKRSPLTCLSFPGKRGFCRKCYGLNLPDNQEVRIGDPVGLIAAQAIGERGTQLAMKSIHGVEGVGEGVVALRKYIEFGKPCGESSIKFAKESPVDFNAFYNTIAEVKEDMHNKYGDIDKIHFMVLWRALCAGMFSEPQDWTRMVRGAQCDKDYWMKIGGEKDPVRKDELVKIALDSACLSMDAPIARVLFDLF